MDLARARRRARTAPAALAALLLAAAPLAGCEPDAAPGGSAARPAAPRADGGQEADSAPSKRDGAAGERDPDLLTEEELKQPPLLHVVGPELARRSKQADPYRAEYEFTRDAFTTNIPVWRKALEPYAGRPGNRYLEIGLFEGRSALWMLENVLTHPSSRLVGMDIFGDPYGIEDVEGRFRRNLEKSGAADRVEVIVGFSQVELRKLPLESFDVVYIDGSHRAADVLEDAVLSYRLLKDGGLLIFDDYTWQRPWHPSQRPEKAIDVFHIFFGDQFEMVHAGYQV